MRGHRAGIVLVVVAAFLALPSPGAATRILALGDFGVGGSREQQTGDAVRAFEATHPADLFLTLGDNDYTRGLEFAASWERSFGWLAQRNVAVAGALGNHDVEVDGGRYEFAALGMPRSYYARSVGDVQVLVLDSNDVGATQTAWLRRTLAASRARWRIAAFHHPPYTCGGHEGSTSVQRAWVPLFARYGVRLVLSGHDHNYQRFAPRRRVTFVVDGGGGAGLYALRGCPRSYPRRVAGRSAHGFLWVQSSKQRLVVRALTLEGAPVDVFTIRR